MNEDCAADASWPARHRLFTMGGDGLATLALSLTVIILTGGISLFWCTGRIAGVARTADTEGPAGATRVVLGVCLHRSGRLPADFEVRLGRVLALDQGPVLLLGGRTNRHVACSEAEAGRDWLIDRGMPAATIELEDGSRNTLENLRALRERLPAGTPPPLLITNRYHLARAGLMAHGLSIEHHLVAAEDRLAWSPALFGKLSLEGFFVHWYHVGRIAARLLRHDGMLGRIT